MGLGFVAHTYLRLVFAWILDLAPVRFWFSPLCSLRCTFYILTFKCFPFPANSQNKMLLVLPHNVFCWVCKWSFIVLERLCGRDKHPFFFSTYGLNLIWIWAFVVLVRQRQSWHSMNKSKTEKNNIAQVTSMIREMRTVNGQRFTLLIPNHQAWDRYWSVHHLVPGHTETQIKIFLLIIRV